MDENALSTKLVDALLNPLWESPPRKYRVRYGWYRKCRQCPFIQDEDFATIGFPQTSHFCVGVFVIWPERWFH